MTPHDYFRELQYQQECWSSDIAALSMLQPLLKDVYLPFSRFSLRPACLAMILNDILINTRKTIIEFGTGVSTIAIARLIRSSGLDAHLFSVEHDDRWLGTVTSAVQKERLEKFLTFIHAPLVSCAGTPDAPLWYNRDILDDRLPDSKIDLMIVDGPPAYEPTREKGRYPALPYLFDRLAADTAIYLDDANRCGEAEVLKQWAAEYDCVFTVTLGTMGYYSRGQHFDPLPFRTS